ncbi:MAG: D-glycero-beta-D-manno-heptose 1-phosphate adenylyltransferase [Candidatus Omnitrophota bacterium]|jgi:D-beta-D-heptose 7-phosphate kinase/D-beta-D-heptose 1-phosphate adenosyltransferase
MNSKIISSTALARKLSLLKARGKRIVFTNGCFDILHVGHVDYLSKARKLGDILVVGLNSDSSVRKIKGLDRPINKEYDRAKILSSLCFVDYVTIFGETTPEKLIQRLKPNVLVKGGDWKKRDIVGSDFVKCCGGRVATIPFVNGYSTTYLINKIKG